LLAAHDISLNELALQTQMTGCWSVMLQFSVPVEVGFDAAFVNEGPLSWVARDNHKPNRPSHESWLLHGSIEWSEAHIEADAQYVIEALSTAFKAIGAPSPSSAQAHRWRYAQGHHTALPSHAWDKDKHIGLCGDWLHGGRVEGAWLSGHKLAQHIIG
jgi:predicted NAD/FAD-dependent oxidoreductase